MSELYPRDPLIKELKGYTAKFLETFSAGNAITDAHPLLLSFEGCLENIFYCSIKAQSGLFGYRWDGSAWRWIQKTDQSDDFYDERYQISRVIESVKGRKNVLTQDGRFRLGLRYCLVRKCLHRPIEHLMTTRLYEKYYMIDAILGDEILTEILLSVIYQLNKIDFKLDLENSSMLDLTWELPRVINVDLVPTRDLGIRFEFAENRAIILSIKANSVASERPEINIGDVIITVNDELVTPSTNRMYSMLKTDRIRPITLEIVKATTNAADTGKLYTPMIKLYKDVKLDPELVRASLNPAGPASPRSRGPILRSLKSLTGFKVTYLGKVCVGRKSEAKTIDKEFATFFWPTSSSSRQSHLKQDVLLEVGELGIRISNIEKKTLVERIMYMDITACSSITLLPNHFGYISGKANSNLPQKCLCYFYSAQNSEQAAVIMRLMGQGFRRTNYAV